MRTVQPTLRNGLNIWNTDVLPEQEFQDRFARVREKMAKQDLDLLFVYGKAFDGKADPGYLSHHVIRLPQGAIVAVPRQGEPALLCEGTSRDLPSVRTTTCIRDVRAGTDLASLCATFLEEMQPSAASVALVGARDAMPHAQYRAIRDSLAGRAIADADDFIAEFRRLKSEREQSRIREAGRVVAAMLADLPQAKAGTERLLEAQVRLSARLKGAEDVRLLFASPQEGEWGLRAPEEQPIRAEEHILVYAAAEIDRYWAEAMRTFVATEAGLLNLENTAVQSAYTAMLASVMPSANANAPVLAGCEAAARAGIKLAEDYGYGNGIGLSLDEAPAVGTGVSGVLQPGMALSVRLFTRDQGGALLGDTLLIHADGSEVVTRG